MISQFMERGSAGRETQNCELRKLAVRSSSRPKNGIRCWYSDDNMEARFGESSGVRGNETTLTLYNLLCDQS